MVWHWIVKSWLQQKAQEKLYEAVAEPARRQTGADRSDESAAQQEPVDVAVQFALPAEAGGMQDLLEDAVTVRGDRFVVHQGRLGDKSVVLLVSGAGTQAARRATAAVIVAHRPRWVISAGFAVGLDADLRRKDLIMADCLADEEGGTFDVDLTPLSGHWHAPPATRVGRVLTVDRIIRAPQERIRLGKQYQALALDMASMGVALACREYDRRVLTLRVVAAEVSQQPSAELEHLLRQQSAAGKLGAVVGSLWRKPSSVKDMFRDKEEALLASDCLAQALAALVACLDGPPAA